MRNQADPLREERKRIGMRKVKVAALQFASLHDYDKNIRKVDELIRETAKQGANIILPSELFEGDYFCQVEDYKNFSLAEDYETSKTLNHYQKLAKELNVVLPISFFEKSGNVFFNSIAVIDADGRKLGFYRKTHIPTGECYEEKFYFSPGDTGFKVWKTKFGTIGVGICWDQWFPECSRIMALQGAELLLFPTAIGSEPVLPKDSKDHWQHVMQGHAAANIMPVIAANRIGLEKAKTSSMKFFGSSFITDQFGNKVEELGREEEGFILHEFDLDQIQEDRIDWGVFRDRRVEMYEGILKDDLSHGNK